MTELRYFSRLYPYWDVVAQKVSSEDGFETFDEAHFHLLNCLEEEVVKAQLQLNRASKLSSEKCKEIPMP